jgi:methylisocitrate lyase
MLHTLREALAGRTDGPLVVPGATDPFMARLIEQHGFPAVYVTGAGTAATIYGMPDVGLVTMTEMLANAERIAQAVSIPVIADADTGFGNAINAKRTVREYERAGIAAIQLEDQDFPKKCGHMDGKRLVEAAEMVGKIHAACDARASTDTMIIARTDALAVSSFDDAVARARSYVAAGADILFPEAMTTREHFADFAAEFRGSVPLIANMTEWGKSPLLTAKELGDMGYSIVIFPSAPMRAAQFAIAEVLDELAATGTQAGLLERMYPRQKLYDLLDLQSVYDDERRYGVLSE